MAGDVREGERSARVRPVPGGVDTEHTVVSSPPFPPRLEQCPPTPGRCVIARQDRRNNSYDTTYLVTDSLCFHSKDIKGP